MSLDNDAILLVLLATKFTKFPRRLSALVLVPHWHTAQRRSLLLSSRWLLSVQVAHQRKVLLLQTPPQPEEEERDG